MTKKAKWLAVIFAFLVVITSGVGLYTRMNNGESNDVKSPEAQQKAISEALQYRSSIPGTCATVLTDAVHTKTGAKYTFPDSCLPPGWEAE